MKQQDSGESERSDVEDMRLRNEKVTNRDLRALRWIAEQYAVRTDRLRWLWPFLGDEGAASVTTERVRQVVQRWETAGIAESEALLARSARWVWPTATGLRALEMPWRFRAPAIGSLHHLDAVSSTRLFIERAWGCDRWQCERELRSESDGQHVADGVWWSHTRPVAVEVEITLKSRRRIARIVTDLLCDYPYVLYVVGSEAIGNAVREVVADDARVAIRSLRTLEPR